MHNLLKKHREGSQIEKLTKAEKRQNKNKVRSEKILPPPRRTLRYNHVKKSIRFH
jgi:hypothetical protein